MAEPFGVLHYPRAFCPVLGPGRQLPITGVTGVDADRSDVGVRRRVDSGRSMGGLVRIDADKHHQVWFLIACGKGNPRPTCRLREPLTAACRHTSVESDRERRPDGTTHHGQVNRKGDRRFTSQPARSPTARYGAADPHREPLRSDKSTVHFSRECSPCPSYQGICRTSVVSRRLLPGPWSLGGLSGCADLAVHDSEADANSGRRNVGRRRRRLRSR